MKNITTWIIVILIVLIGGWLLLSSSTTPKNEGPIKIGVVSPLTGGAAPYGEVIKNGVEIAVEEINANGGINNRKIQIIAEDGKCTGKDAVSSAQKLISVDKVTLIIGGACSAETLAMAPVMEKNEIPLISPSASAPSITNAGNFVFRTIPSDVTASIIIADAMAKESNSVGIVTENSDYPQGVREGALKRWKELGVNVVADEIFNPEVTDFKTQLLSFKSNPDAIFINPQTGGNGARLVKQIRELGITSQIYAFFITGDEFIKSGPETEGVIIFDYPALEGSESGGKFLQKYKEKYGTTPQYGIFAATAYDTTYIMVQALKKIGTKGRAIRDYLYSMPTFKGVYFPRISFDKNGDLKETFDLIKLQVVNGELKKIE